jgi:hypothetical protein
VDDGFVNAATVEAHKQGMGVVTLTANSAEEVRAAAALLTRNATPLTPQYLEYFTGLSPNHCPVAAASGGGGGGDSGSSGGGGGSKPGCYHPSFLVPPTKVPERPPKRACSNPACGKLEEPSSSPKAVVIEETPTSTTATTAATAGGAAEGGAAAAARLPAAAASNEAAATAGPADEKFMVCTACKAAFYCGKACQKQHWQAHKEQCATEKVRLKMVAEGQAAAAKQRQQQQQQQQGGGKQQGAGGEKGKKKGRGKRDKV